jgi:hypothetical protein
VYEFKKIFVIALRITERILHMDNDQQQYEEAQGSGSERYDAGQQHWTDNTQQNANQAPNHNPQQNANQNPEPRPTNIVRPNAPSQYPPARPTKPAPIALSPDQRLTNLEKALASLEARLKKKIANL